MRPCALLVYVGDAPADALPAVEAGGLLRVRPADGLVRFALQSGRVFAAAASAGAVDDAAERLFALLPADSRRPVPSIAARRIDLPDAPRATGFAAVVLGASDADDLLVASVRVPQALWFADAPPPARDWALTWCAPLERWSALG